MSFDTARIRAQFPILERQLDCLGGKRPLVFMDHGASTHAPKPVLDAVQDLLSHHYANIHRGNHTLSLESSDAFDAAPQIFSDFLGADASDKCYVMVQNTTQALDVAAHVMAEVPGKTLTTRIEHHSNDLPHRRRGGPGGVVYADVDEQGRLRMDEVEAQLQNHDIKLLAVTGASNVTGYTPEIGKLARMAHDNGAKILVDAAQLYAHKPINVRDRDHPEHIDLLAAAGHKAYAPLGGAFLMGSRDLLDAATPYIPGGGTVDWVSDDGELYTSSPDRHMGGTPNVAGAVAFAAATQFLADIGMDNVREHEVELTNYALGRFRELEGEGVELLGPKTADEKAGVFSFIVNGVRHDLASAILNHEYGIATRNGCFCAHPLLHRLLRLEDTSVWTDALARGENVPLPGATRATIGVYNTREEVELLFDGIEALARKSWKGNYDTSDPKHVMPAGAVAVSVKIPCGAT